MSTVLESQKVRLTATPEKVFNFAIDFNHFDQLLPRDKISDWKSDVDFCSFRIQNAATIPLVKNGTTPHSRIDIVNGNGAPFTFTLVIHIEPEKDGCSAWLVFDGDINPFLKMMVAKPLQNLFDFMAERLKRIHGSPETETPAG